MEGWRGGSGGVERWGEGWRVKGMEGGGGTMEGVEGVERVEGEGAVCGGVQ